MTSVPEEYQNQVSFFVVAILAGSFSGAAIHLRPRIRRSFAHGQAHVFSILFFSPLLSLRRRIPLNPVCWYLYVQTAAVREGVDSVHLRRGQCECARMSDGICFRVF